jgi:hypothetical protein
MPDRARWFRRYVLATMVGFVVLLLPVLWFALVRAYLSGTWAVTLRFNALGEGPSAERYALVTGAEPRRHE